METKGTKTRSRSTTATSSRPGRLSGEERAAMAERTKELKAEARGANAEKAVLEKIAEMPEPDRVMAERIHTIIKASAPSLSPKTWYGMPAYANGEGKVVCFF